MAEYNPNINATMIGDITMDQDQNKTKIEEAEMIFEEKAQFQFQKQKVNNAMKNMSAGQLEVFSV